MSDGYWKGRQQQVNEQREPNRLIAACKDCVRRFHEGEDPQELLAYLEATINQVNYRSSLWCLPNDED